MTEGSRLDPMLLSAWVDQELDATDQAIAAWEQKNGLDRPVLAQYGVWLRALVLQGDLGRSPVTGLAMNQRIRETLQVTLEIVSLAFVFSVLLSIGLGTVSAFMEGSLADQLSRLFAVLGVSVPGFWLGLLLTLPINLLTLGLFTFVINGLLFWLTARFLDGFEVAKIGRAHV